ncbi:hypothetical protein BGZ91_009055, partial [Linnemannia elongata]
MAKVFENTFFKNVPLSTFSGHPKESVQDWLSELDEYLGAVNATHTQKVVAARLLMRDNARRWLKLCPPAPENTNPWEYFKKCVLARFQSANHKYFARSKLYQLKQRNSVTKYIAEFQDLCSQIDDIMEPEALQVFLMGLKPAIQIHFAGNPTLRQDLNMVMQIAENLDNVQYQNRNRLVTPWPRPSFESRNNSETFPQPMDLDSTSHTGISRNPNQEKQKQLDLNNRTCFICHATGHQARGCPRKAQSRNLASMDVSGALNGATHSPSEPTSETTPFQIKQPTTLPLSSIPKSSTAKTTSSLLPTVHTPSTVSTPVSLVAEPTQVPIPTPSSSSLSVDAPTLFYSSAPVTMFNTSTLPFPASPSDSSDFPILPEESEDEHVMYIAGHIKNHKFDVLIDSGASANYINQEIVRALNIPTSKKKETLSVNGFDNGQVATCTRYCHIRLQLAPNFQPIIQFLVIPMRFDLVLGKRWQARSVPKPDIDLVNHTIRISPVS